MLKNFKSWLLSIFMFGAALIAYIEFFSPQLQVDNISVESLTTKSDSSDKKSQPEDKTTENRLWYEPYFANTAPINKDKRDVGVLILDESDKPDPISRKILIAMRNSEVLPKDNLFSEKFITEYFESINAGTYNVKILPFHLYVDEIILGRLRNITSQNSAGLFKTNVSLLLNFYKSQNLELIKVIEADGQGLNGDLNLSVKQARERLWVNLEKYL